MFEHERGPTVNNVTQVGNAAVIVVVGADNSLWYYWQEIGDPQWHAEQVAPAGSILVQQW
jgi:hypothetical protein